MRLCALQIQYWYIQQNLGPCPARWNDKARFILFSIKSRLWKLSIVKFKTLIFAYWEFNAKWFLIQILCTTYRHAVVSNVNCSAIFIQLSKIILWPLIMLNSVFCFANTCAKWAKTNEKTSFGGLALVYQGLSQLSLVSALIFFLMVEELLFTFLFGEEEESS